MFSHLHMYGATQYHLPGMAPLTDADMSDQIQGQRQHDTSLSSFPRATYYPVIDPQIDVPQAQANISSERYDPSVTTDPTM